MDTMPNFDMFQFLPIHPEVIELAISDRLHGLISQPAISETPAIAAVLEWKL